MGHPALLAAAVVAPITGGVLATLLGRRSGRAALIVAVASLAVAFAALVTEAPAVLGRGVLVTEHFGGFAPVDGHQLAITWTADGFGLVVALTVAAIGAVLVGYALSELSDLGPHELGWLAALSLFLCAGVIGAALTADLLNMFVWFEVSALASYGLTAFWLERPVALEAAFKIAVLTAIAGFLVFVGMGLLYQQHGAVNFGELHRAMAGAATRVDVAAVALLLAGFATKAGLVAFHTWLPDAHSAAPGPVSAMFSGLLILLGVVGVVRTVFVVADPHALPMLGVLTALGIVSGVVGALAALGQDDLKRLLGFDTIAEVGLITIGLATGRAAGIAAAAMLLVNHALFKSLLFLDASAIVHATGEERLSKLRGIGRSQPVLAAIFVLGAAALVGVPPLNGYASFGVLHADLREHAPVLLGAAVLIEVLITAALTRATCLVLFVGERRATRQHGPKVGMVAAMAVLGLLCVVAGVAASAVARYVGQPSAAGLLHAGDAAAAMLGGSTRLELVAVHADLLDPFELMLTAGILAIGIGLGVRLVRARQPAPVRAVRALHTGSVHDDVAAMIVGVILVAVALAPGH
jgi:multicomponent Na+:H+ antiporter subunit D